MATGTMQHWPLTVSQLVEYAARWHGEQEIICKTVEVSAAAALQRAAASGQQPAGSRRPPLSGSMPCPRDPCSNCWIYDSYTVPQGATVICNYRDLRERSRLCALALRGLGVRPGTVVGTLAW